MGHGTHLSSVHWPHIIWANVTLHSSMSYGTGILSRLFRKPSIEDFVKLFLSLLLHLGIADHRQKKVPRAEAVVSALAEVMLHWPRRSDNKHTKCVDSPIYAWPATFF